MNFTEQQMSDPWGWCLSVLQREGMTSKQVAEKVDAPWSTLRGLYNGTNESPRYQLLKDIIALCVSIEKEETPVEEVAHDFI